MKIPIYHKYGYSPCGNLGGYLIGPIGTNAILHACDIELLDGTNPEPDSILRCNDCKEVMYLSEIYLERTL